MNPITSPDSQEAAHLEKLRSQISTDIESMHRQEASLREYEQRLRLLVDHAHNGTPTQPATQYIVASTPGQQASDLDAAWEKYERAHALLEAARRGLSDDRMALKDREEKIMIREQEVARREAWVKVREEELAAKIQAQAAAVATAKAKPSFTAAPFLAAKNLLHLGKAN
jgi:chaperonin cofactor prefoldin